MYASCGRLREVERKLDFHCLVTPCTSLKQSDRPTLSYQNNTMGQLISALPAAVRIGHSGSSHCSITKQWCRVVS